MKVCKSFFKLFDLPPFITGMPTYCIDQTNFNLDVTFALSPTGGDDVSMGDPDDILDRFMAKQRYNR